MTSSLRIIVTGLIAQCPLGGMTWHYLQYVLGLARLGHDVYYVEDTGMWPYNPGEGGLGADCADNVGYLAGVMARFGLAERWAYRFCGRAQWFGLPDGKRTEVLRSADLLLSVSGALERSEDYRHVRRVAYIDTDPVFTQVKLGQGRANLRDRVEAADVHFSFGERLAEAVPAAAHRWRPTRQPVVLSAWDPRAPRRQVFATVMHWTMKYKPIAHGGRTYPEKDVEFLRFLELPRLVAPAALEVAVNAGRGRQAPRYLLASRGWRVVDPEEVCPDFEAYHRYIESSLAEWSVAKGGYARERPGWFSDRSACYLAAG